MSEHDQHHAVYVPIPEDKQSNERPKDELTTSVNSQKLTDSGGQSTGEKSTQTDPIHSDGSKISSIESHHDLQEEAVVEHVYHEHNPRKVLKFVESAKEFLEHHKYMEAAISYDRIVNIYLKARQFDKAFENVKNALKCFPKDYGTELLKKKSFEESSEDHTRHDENILDKEFLIILLRHIDSLRQHVKDQDLGFALKNLANLSEIAGELDLAAEVILQAGDIFGASEDLFRAKHCYYQAGALYFKTKRYDIACRCFEMCLGLLIDKKHVQNFSPLPQQHHHGFRSYHDPQRDYKGGYSGNDNVENRILLEEDEEETKESEGKQYINLKSITTDDLVLNTMLCRMLDLAKPTAMLKRLCRLFPSYTNDIPRTVEQQCRIIEELKKSSASFAFLMAIITHWNDVRLFNKEVNKLKNKMKLSLLQTEMLTVVESLFFTGPPTSEEEGEEQQEGGEQQKKTPTESCQVTIPPGTPSWNVGVRGLKGIIGKKQIRLATFNVENLYARYRFSLFDKEALPPKGASFSIRDVVFKEFEDKPEKQITAATIRECDADFLALQEVEGLQVLDNFVEQFLFDMGYQYRIIIDGHDPRNIEVGILSRFPVLCIKSNRHLWKKDGSKFLFPRDCLEVTVAVDNKPLQLYITHLTSMINGREETKVIRMEQAEMVAKLVDDAQKPNSYNSDFAVLGDLNDYPGEGTSLDSLLKHSALVNVVERMPKQDRWTHYFSRKNEYHQLDYILLSKKLAENNPNSVPVVVRKGLPWRAKDYDGKRLPRVGFDRPKASDHCPVYIDLNLS